MITDNTAKWRVKKVTEFIGNSLPIGHFYQTISPTVPAGSLPLFGGTYSRTLYADLWIWIQQSGLLITESAWQSKATANEGNVPFFSQGDGSTTFRVPSMKCWVKGANGVEEVGSYLEAGLPNITGDFYYGNGYSAVGFTALGADEGTVTGAFALGTTRGWSLTGAGYEGRDLVFDASLSNPIYGKSNTVQPKSIVGMWCIVAYGTVSNVGNADVASVMQAIETAQTVASEANSKIVGISDYIIESYRNGTEWYEVYKSGKVRQGGRFTCSDFTNTNTTFLKVFANSNYTLILNKSDINYGSYGQSWTGLVSRSATGFVSKNNSTRNVDWIAEGQGA